MGTWVGGEGLGLALDSWMIQLQVIVLVDAQE